MSEENIKAPELLDFSGDVLKAIDKLEYILYTSGWSKYLVIHPDTPNEDKLLFSLIRERAIVVGELYYTYTYDFTDELKARAYNYFHRLKKRDMDNIYLNAVNYFSRREADIEKTDNGALFYPEIKAYVRCGNLSPEKMFELMQKDGCERVIIFGNGLRLDKEQPWEVFHSFEMRAPKEYIIEELNKLQEERMEQYHAVMEKSGINDVFKNIKLPDYIEDEN